MSESITKGLGNVIGGIKKQFERLPHWTPNMDMKTNSEELHIYMDIPGMNKEDISMEVLEGSLVVRGVRHHEENRVEDDWQIQERSWGEFVRAVPLPMGAVAKDIKAEYKNGVLDVVIPVQSQLDSIPIAIDAPSEDSVEIEPEVNES